MKVFTLKEVVDVLAEFVPEEVLSLCGRLETETADLESDDGRGQAACQFVDEVRVALEQPDECGP